MKINYDFIAKVWKHSSSGGWYFISLPEIYSTEIRKILFREEEGWGRLKVLAKVRNSEWKTAIWFDTKHNTYLLPIKSDIRTKEKIELENEIHITISI